MDPAALMVFTAVFVLIAVATMRRAALGVAALAFVTPFAFYNTVGLTTITFPKVTVVAVAVGLLPSWRCAIVQLREVRLTLWGFASILVAIALSGFGAHNGAAVFTEFFKWIEYTLFFGVAYAGFTADPNDTWVRRAFYASIAIVCITALGQEFVGSPWVIAVGPGVVPRISGWIEGPNQLAGYLEIALAVVLGWGTGRRSRAGSALAVLIGLTLLLTFSRGGIVGCLVVVATIAWFRRRDALRAATDFVGGAVVGALADAVWIQAARRLPALRNPSGTMDGPGGLGTRSELWRAALFFFRRHPLFGIGAGNYETSLAQAGVYGVRTHANNLYLQALAEGGVVLFGATIFFIVAALLQLRDAVRSSAWALAAFAATLALAIHQLADYLVFYPKVAEPWMILLALGMASRQIDRSCDS